MFVNYRQIILQRRFRYISTKGTYGNVRSTNVNYRQLSSDSSTEILVQFLQRGRMGTCLERMGTYVPPTITNIYIKKTAASSHAYACRSSFSSRSFVHFFGWLVVLRVNICNLASSSGHTFNMLKLSVERR